MYLSSRVEGDNVHICNSRRGLVVFDLPGSKEIIDSLAGSGVGSAFVISARTETNVISEEIRPAHPHHPTPWVVEPQ